MAANSILKLKVESEEYDAKLKKAAEGIRHLAEVAHKGGGGLTGLEKSELDYIKALGDMETKSRTAAGSTRELENTFKELTVIYNNLNDVEKADEGGKALAASLETLKQRALDAKAGLNEATQALRGNEQSAAADKGGIEGLTSALGINIKTLAGWGTAISAGKVALDVAKDAFFASESSVDEWGRTVAASQSLYEGFLTAINNGDISGYLSNIDSIVKAARLAYDELDKLGTMKTIQAPQISKQQTENERIRSMIQTGRYIAPQDGRKNAVFNGREMQAGDKLTAGQIRALEKQLQGGMQKMVKLVGNEVDQTGKAINAYYDKLAKTNGMSLQEFKKGTSSWEEFSKKMKGYEDYKKWDKEARAEFAKQGGRGNVDFDKSNPYAEFRKWGTFRVDKEGDNSYKDLVALIQQRDQQVGQVYSTQAQAYRTMNRAEGVTVRQIMGGTGGKGGKGGKIDKNLDDEQKVQQKINDLLKEALTADANRQGEIRQQVAELQKQQEKYKDIKNIAQGILPKDKEAVFTIDGQLSEETKKNLREIEGVTIDDKTMTVTAETDDALRALQGIEGVTIDPKTVTITATDEALPKLREIQGVTIDDKTMTVRAETADALRALQGIEGVTIDPKTVTITATDEALPKLREIQGVTIDDKTMTVTANTQEAMQKVQELIGQVSTTTLQMKVAPPDLDKLFPDMSKANFNTGYAGSAQAKADSAIADFAQGGVGNADISGFISSAKQAIDQSELGDDLYNKMTEKLKDATMFQSVLTQAIAGGASAADLAGVAQEIKQKLLEGDIDESAWQEFLDKINELIQNADLKLTFDVDTKNVTTAVKQQKKETAEMAKEWQAAGSAIQAVGSAMSQIEDPAAKVLGIIAQAVATMALSYSQAAASPAVTGSGWGWIAFAATGLATMISSINGIKQATEGFANGGVIPGNSMSGDNLRGMTPDGTIYGLNSQEIILNRAQQGNLAAQLEGSPVGGTDAQPYLDGEKIYLGLQAYMRRSGLGEIVTSER